MAAICLTAALLLSISCQSTNRSSVGRTASRATPTPRNIAPPDGLDPVTVAQHEAGPMAKARMTLDQIVASLPRPGYLPSPEDIPGQPDAANITSDNLSRAAQRAYVAGRQAIHENRVFDAIQHLSAADRLAPNQPQILRLLAQAYLRSGVRSRGAQYLAQVVQLDRSDVVSLFHLGRHALEQGQWNDAIVTFAYALQRRPQIDRADPGIWPLLHFFLASALEHERYDQAALEQFHAFTAINSENLNSRFAGELRVLQRQAMAMWMTVGDASCRLGDLEAALEAYLLARQAGGRDDLDLLRRTVYVQLRLGHDDDAVQTLLTATEPNDISPDVLDLMRYAASNGINTGPFLDRLRQIYDAGNRNANITLAIVDLLPLEEADDFLLAHIRRNPHDDVAFERALEMELRAGVTDQTLVRAALATLAARENAPHRVAQRHVGRLFDVVGNLDTLLTALDSADSATRDTLQPIRALALVRLGRTDEAQAVYETILAARPDAQRERVELAELLLSQKRYDEALATLEPLAKTSDPAVVLVRARALTQVGQDLQALMLVEAALAENSRDADLIVQKGDILMRRGDYTAAELALVQALNERPDAEVIYLKLSEIYQSGRLRDSEVKERWLNEKALRTIPHSRMARYVQVDQYMSSRPPRVEQAVRLLKELVEEDPDDERAFGTLIGIYLATEQLEEGNQLVEKQLSRRPNHQRWNELAAYYYTETQQYLPLARLLGRMLENRQLTDPVMGLRRYLLAMREVGQLEEADRFARGLVAVYPNLAADITYYRSSLFAHQDPARYEAILLEALQHDPKHAPTNNDLGYIWADRGENLDKALQMVQTALEAEPDNANYRDSLGWVYYKLGRFEEAIAELTKASNDPKGGSPVIVEHLGDALYRAGRTDEAAQVWRRTLNEINQLYNLDPSLRRDEELRECADRIRQKLTDIAAQREPRLPDVPGLDGSK